MGYHQAGFEVVGVDNKRQPRYPFEFHQADALEYVKEHGHEFDVIHASPPCQPYSRLRAFSHKDKPQLMGPVTGLLKMLGKPFVIENVPGATVYQSVLLCGTMFPQLRTYRHRMFLTSFPLPQPEHPEHLWKSATMGRGGSETRWPIIAGHFQDLQGARDAMGIDWMTQTEMSQAIPPAYTQYVGRYARQAITG
jgi:DNA (cytosine-5)-methyltransferase 1